MSEMVGPEVLLEAVGGGLPLWNRHHPGTVDQHVDGHTPSQELRAEARDRAQVGQIQRQPGGVGAECGDGVFGPVGVAGEPVPVVNWTFNN
ncbi:hypothetical protein Q0Z83_037340 [Actinoplanes sichuanensis]|nr:hypothetical protein Q0Z83_037340 [Actinoplanes sichuanensis]